MKTTKKIRLFLSFVALVIAVVPFVLKTDNKNTQVLSTSTQNTSLETYFVNKVIDGDTIHVQKADQESIIRLVGINTPEIGGTEGKYCFGEEAKSYTNENLYKKQVTIEPDPTQEDKDVYGRLLRYVYLNGNTKSFNEILVENGYAREYKYKTNYQYREKFVEAQNKAKQKNLGLWGAGCNKGN